MDILKSKIGKAVEEFMRNNCEENFGEILDSDIVAENITEEFLGPITSWGDPIVENFYAAIVGIADAIAASFRLF